MVGNQDAYSWDYGRSALIGNEKVQGRIIEWHFVAGWKIKFIRGEKVKELRGRILRGTFLGLFK